MTHRRGDIGRQKSKVAAKESIRFLFFYSSSKKCSPEQTESNINLFEQISVMIKLDYLLCYIWRAGGLKTICRFISPPRTWWLKLSELRSVITAGCQQFITALPRAPAQRLDVIAHMHAHARTQKKYGHKCSVDAHKVTHMHGVSKTQVSVWQHITSLSFMITISAVRKVLIGACSDSHTLSHSFIELFLAWQANWFLEIQCFVFYSISHTQLLVLRKISIKKQFKIIF